MISIRALVFILALMIAFGGLSRSSLRAQRPENQKKSDPQTKAAGKTGDQELLQDLFEGLDASPAKPKSDGAGAKGPDRPAPNGKGSPPKPGKPASPIIDGEDIGAESTDSPLAKIVTRMRQVQKAFVEQDVTEATQSDQQQIVDDLSQLIAQASKNRQRPKSSSGREKKSSSSANDAANDTAGANPQGTSSDQRDPPKAGAPMNTAEASAWIKEVWGQLPDRIRQQIQAPRAEQFLPKYEKVIADYYRRLAEESPETM